MFYSFITVYNFDKKKIKMDYATIPVELKENELLSKISVSKFSYPIKEFEKGKTFCKVACLSDDFNEEEIKKKLSNLFNRHFWYKFKFKKFLTNRLKRI